MTFLVLFLLSTSADATRRRTESKLQRLAEAEQLATGYAEAERARKQAEAALTAGDVSLLTYVTEKGHNGRVWTFPPSTPRATSRSGTAASSRAAWS